MNKQLLMERARQIYADLVRRRTRVEVISDYVSGDCAGAGAFILSPYRSGTTLLRFCLDSHPDLAVPPETDYLVPLLALVEDDVAMRGLADMGYGSDAVRARLAAFSRTFLDSYASGRGALGWCDKTPSYAELPLPLLGLFPKAHYVILHRHPLDQIYSFTKDGSFAHPALRLDGCHDRRRLLVAAAEYWSRVTEGLQDFTAMKEVDACVLRYEDLCEEPRVQLGKVLSHLDLEWSDNVLEYHKFPHDVGRQSGRIGGTVGFSPVEGKWRTWDQRTLDEVWALVKVVAGKQGYDLVQY